LSSRISPRSWAARSRARPAAHSIIYAKLIGKEEMLPEVPVTPHADEEAMLNRMVGCLRIDDCRKLYDRTRDMSGTEALVLAQACVMNRDRA